VINTVFLLSGFFLFVILIEVPVLARKKMWRELAAFSVYLLLGMTLSFPQVLGAKIPNPTRIIEAVFKPVAELLK
jgi:hypothetical protein